MEERQLKGVRWWRTLVVLAVLISLAAAALIPGINWRGRVAWAKASGKLSDITWVELIPMLAPRHSPNLGNLAEHPNMHEAIRNPHESLADIAAGRLKFESTCLRCHGPSARPRGILFGGTDLIHGNSDWAVYRNIQRGIAKTRMPAFDLPEKTAWQLVAYVQSLQGPNRTNPADSNPGVAFAEVNYDRILHARPEEWPTYSGQYRGLRNSGLRSINRENVGRLEPGWKHKVFGLDVAAEATPLVVGQVMYVTMPPSRVLAINAITGRLIWSFERRLPAKVPLCCGIVNRGVAVLGNRVYYASADAHLIALEMSTGHVAWDVKMADSEQGYSSTAAPLAVKDRIIIGIAGGEFGIRGFIDAYDAETGRRIWRLNTIPGPGEPGHDTWEGESWKSGGAPTWMTGSFDPETNIVYWGVGNPGPDYNPENREGINLYTNSLLALDADSGRLRWYFQFTPHDVTDYDANQVPVLVDLPWRGQSRKLVLTANKNGFFYVLDRTTGKFLAAVQLARQNWARIAEDGLPVPVPVTGNSGTRPGYPSGAGAANWFPPSFNPGTNFFYVPIRERGVMISRRQETYSPGSLFFGGISATIEEPRWTALLAVDPILARVVWQVRDSTEIAQFFGGTLSTDGGLIFWGHGNAIEAFDARSGRVLWRFDTGEPIRSAPMTYSIGGKQRIVIVAGHAVMAFELPE